MDESCHADLLAWNERQDQQAFSRLVERYQRLVSAVCRRRLGNGDEADEATQATFIIFAQRAADISNPHALESWLYEVARRVCRQARRAAERRARHEQDAAMHSADNQRAVTPPTTEWEDLRPQLDDAIAALSANERAVVISYFMHGQQQADVAAYLGISESAVRKRIATAVEKMRGWFSRRGLGVGAAALIAGLASEAHAAPDPSLAAACTQAALHPASAVGASALASSALAVSTTKVAALALTAGLVLSGGTVAAVQVLRPGAHPIEPATPSSVERPHEVGTAAEPASRVSAPPPMDSAPSASAERTILRYDFENGIRPATLIDGDVVPGPARVGNRFSVAAIDRPHNGLPQNEIVFTQKPTPLFTYEEGLRLEFDCWPTADQWGIGIYIWDEMKHDALSTMVPITVQDQWIHVSVPLSDFILHGDGNVRFSVGDVLSSLSIGSPSESGGRLHIDNLEIKQIP